MPVEETAMLDQMRAINRLATQMFNRKKNRRSEPFVLMLGSKVMPIRTIENQVFEARGLEASEIATMEEFTRDLKLRDDWAALRMEEANLIESLETGFRNGVKDWPGKGYRSLARLIDEGYFDVILTADVSQRLEAALIERRVSPERWRVFSNDEGSPGEVLRDRVQRAFQPVKIVKLNGDLYDSFAFDPPSLDAFAQNVKPLLDELLSRRSLIVVGYAQERDRWDFPNAGGSIVLVNEEPPSHRWRNYESILVRAKDAIIHGEGADLDGFFGALGPRLLGGENGEAPGLETLEKAGIAVSEIAEETIESSNLIELVSELQISGQAAEGLVDLTEPTLLSIHFDRERRLSFEVRGSVLSHASDCGEITDIEPTELNEVLNIMARDISAYRRLGDSTGLDSWRHRAKREGRDLYKRLLAGNAELMQMWGMAKQAASDDLRYLHLNFLGPQFYILPGIWITCRSEEILRS